MNDIRLIFSFFKFIAIFSVLIIAYLIFSQNGIELLSRLIAIGFIGFIVFVTVYCLSSFSKKTKELEENIKSAIKALPKEDCRSQFVGNYHQINENLGSTKHIFKHLWKEFTEQLIEPDSEEFTDTEKEKSFQNKAEEPDSEESTDTEKEKSFQNSIRPEKFFTLEYLLKKKNINSKLLNSMPGILVGLGVLGTFVGLSISLYQISPDLATEDKNTKEAIQTLISGSSVAFFTSVAGLVCSLLFNWFLDNEISILQKHLNDFNSNLEACLKFITEEHLSILNFKELKEQNRYLKGMDENIALKIGDQIGHRIEQMGKQIKDSISTGNQNISEKFLSDIANTMTQDMGDFSRKQIESLDKTLSALQNNVPPLISRLENSQRQNEEKVKEIIDYFNTISQDNQKQINQSLIEATRNMRTEFDSINQNMKEVMGQTFSQSSVKIQELISSLTQINQELLQKTDASQTLYQEKLNETATKLQTFTSHLEKNLLEIKEFTNTNLREVLSNFSQTMEQQEQITVKNSSYIDSLESLTHSLQPIPSALHEVSIKFPEIIQQINNSNTRLEQSWSNYEKRFKNVDESATQIFIKIKEGLGSVAKESANYVDKLNKQTAQVSSSFAQAVEELKDGIEELKERPTKES